MKRINVNCFPRSGYFFKERDGTIIRADVGWAGVIARLKNYRKRNGFPPGNPEDEVHEFACQQNPNLCTEITNSQIEQQRRVSIKGKLLAWLNSMRKKIEKEPAVFVSTETAKARADVCAGCQFNTPVSESCTPCRKAMNELRRAIIGGRTIDSRVTGCLVLSEDIPTTVWIEQQTVSNPELPPPCWRRRQ